MACFIALPQTSFSQNSEGQAFLHTIPTEEELPAPGDQLTLFVNSLVTDDSNLPLRFIASIDGRYTSFPLKNGKLDANDLPEYSVTVPAPRYSMSYRFVIVDEQGTATSSPQYSVERDCAIQETAQNVINRKDIVGQERLDLVVHQVKTLKREIKALHHARGLAKELESLVQNVSKNSENSES